MSAARQLAVDAKRYRWLRARWGVIITETIPQSPGPYLVNKINVHEAFRKVDADSLDRAVDAAMKEHP